MADVKKRYDWSYYSTISALPDGWTSINDNRAVVLNDEIHVIFDGKHHYKWTGSEWVSVSTLPYDVGNGSNASGFVIVLNNEIHALGLLTEDGKDSGKGHYAWDGQNWREVSVLPDYFNFQGVVVYNGEIHLLGGPNASSHIKFNGSSWEEVSTLPEDVPWCQAVVCDGKIHVLNSDDTKHWAFDGTSWAEVSTLPYYTGGFARVVVIDDEIHIFSGSDDWYTTHYRWDGTKWIDTSIIPYYLGVNIASTVVYNGVIYGISSDAMYSIGKLVDDNDYDWDDIESLGDLPYDFVDGCVLKYNDEIHILGSSVSGNETKHYKYDGSNFYEVSTLPYSFYKGSAVIYGGVINILGGEEGPKNWYKFNGTSWESSVELPFDLVDGMAYVITGFNYNDLNDEQLQIVVGTDKYAGIHTSEDQWSVYTYDNVPAPVGKNSILLHNLQKHLLSGTYHYKYDGVWWLSANKNTLDEQSWDSDSALPYDFHNGAAVSINDEIHILGSDTSGNGTKHYSWNSSTLTWEEVSTLPYDFHNGAAIVYEDEVYIFGGTNNAKGFTKIGSIVKPDPPTPPEPPVPDTDYEYLDKEGLRHLIDLIKSDSVTTYIGSFEKDVALYSHSVGDILYFKDGFYKVTSSISEGDAISVGLNIVGAGLDAGTVVYIWGFPNKDEKYNAIYMVNEDGTGTEYANNLSGSAEPAVDKTYTIKLNLADQNPDTWCTRVEGNVTEIGSGMTENEIDDFMGYYPCMLLNGVEGKRLNPDNYAQDLNGVPVDIVSGADGDAMVKFPARGYKVSKSGNEITISITKERNKTGYTYLTYNGKSVKSFYESVYEGYINDGVLASLSGQNPTTNKKIGELRDATGTTTEPEAETYYDWSLSDGIDYFLVPPEYVPDQEEIHIVEVGDFAAAIEYEGFVHVFGLNHINGSDEYGNQKHVWNEHFRFNENSFEHLTPEGNPDEHVIRLELVSESPYSDDAGQPFCTVAVVYENKIHVFYNCIDSRSYVGKVYHMIYDGTSWGTVSDSAPGIIRAIEYNEEIHAIAIKSDGSLKHVKYDGSIWEDIFEFSDIPDHTGITDLQVYEGKIHFMRKNDRTDDPDNRKLLDHYIYDGTRWSHSNVQIDVGSYDTYFHESLMKLSESLYYIASYGIYKLIDDSWAYCADGNALWLSAGNLPVRLNGRLYLLGGNQSGSWGYQVYIYGDTVAKKIVDWNSKYISDLSDTLGATLVVFNDELHLLGVSDDQGHNIKHYKYNGSSIEEVSTMPYEFHEGCAEVIDNKIHIFGSNYWAVDSDNDNRPYSKKHYAWDGSTWISYNDLPFRVTGSTSLAVVNNVAYSGQKQIHLIQVGTTEHDSSTDKNVFVYKKHYWANSSFSSWNESAEITNTSGSVSYNNEIYALVNNNGAKLYRLEPNNEYWEDAIVLSDENIKLGGMFVFNDEFHFSDCRIKMSNGIFSPNHHLKYDGNKLIDVSDTITNANCVAICNDIYGGCEKIGSVIANRLDYNWGYNESIGELPYDFIDGASVIFNGELHIFGSSVPGNETKHYKYNGSSWEEVAVLPEKFSNGSATVYHKISEDEQGIKHYSDEIHAYIQRPTGDEAPNDTEGIRLIFNGLQWGISDDVEWSNQVNFTGSSAVNIPGPGRYGDGSWWDDQGTILAIGGTGEKGEKTAASWTVSNQCCYAVSDTLPFSFTDGSAIIHNGKVHALFGDYHYKMYSDDPSCWTSANKITYQESFDPDSALPYTFYNGSAISVDDEIHIFGGTDNGTKHYKWSSTTLTWEEVSRLPYDFLNGDAIIYNDEVYLIGGANSPKAFTRIGKRTKQSTPYEQLTFNVLTYLQCCAIIKYKARNIQQVLGMGYTYNNSQPLMTGSMNERGLNWGEGSGNQGVKLFGLENPYGNLDKYVDGVYIDETGQLKVSDGDFNDTGDGYTAVGQPISAYRVFGFLKDILGITSGGFVSDGTVGGSDSTYFCDFTEIVPGKVATQGGNLNSGSLAGLTSLSLNVSPDSAPSNVTARLTYFDVDED